VVAISETLHRELGVMGLPIGVTVACPAQRRAYALILSRLSNGIERYREFLIARVPGLSGAD
jgi:hypothetical protein